MDNKVLFVDDEQSILDGYRRILHREFLVSTANSGQEGLEMIGTDGPFAVVVSDMRMPAMNGALFLSKARERAPDTVRMLLTGYSDLDAAIDAVNSGNIFRYLTKPCQKEVLVEAIQSGVAQYHAIHANKELVKKAQLIAKSTIEWEAKDVAQTNEFTEAQGMPGPAEARECLNAIFAGEHKGYVVLIKLTIRQIVEDRYGPEAASDYIKATMKYLMRSMGPTDRLFHWSPDVLMIVVRRQLSPVAMRVEIARFMQDRRESITDVNGRQIMVAAPTAFDVLPIAQFANFDEMITTFDVKLTGKLG